jgi:hypothetical protein
MMTVYAQTLLGTERGTVEIRFEEARSALRMNAQDAGLPPFAAALFAALAPSRTVDSAVIDVDGDRWTACVNRLGAGDETAEGELRTMGFTVTVAERGRRSEQ